MEVDAVRRFYRRLRASDMKAFLKTGCDMGWYGHFVELVKIDKDKMKRAIRRIMDDIR